MIQISKPSRAPIALIIAGFTATLVLALPSHAQPQGGGKDLRPVCLKLEVAGEEPFSIIVPAGDADNLKAAGYEDEPCGKAFRSREERTAWRERMCELASVPLEDVQKSFEAKLKVRPQQLCGMAELIVGQWQRKKPS